MANKKINELSSRVPSLSDLMIVGDPSSGYSYKCTVTALADIIETDIGDAFVTLSTTQTISGAKTFSNIITATSVANTPTDPDKFLTLNASNQLTYRTGTQVLSDIGGQGALTLTTTGTSGAATLVGNTLNIPQYTDQYTGTVTSVAASAGTGISISGSPITTSGTLTITNTAPDQVVALTGGTGISISGTYPNFTITNSSPSSGGTVTSVAMTVPTGLSVTGTPITSSGTLAVSLQTGYSIPTTASQANWDSAYNDKINSASVTGTTTKTLTLTQQDGGTVTASWSDLDSGTITGSGTTNYIPKFTSSSAIGNSGVVDNGTSMTFAANTYALGASNTTEKYLQFKYSSGDFYVGGTSSYAYLYTASSTPLAFFINNAEQMRLTSTGLGIGTSSPTAKLQVSNSSSDGIIITTTANVEPYLAIQRNSGSSGVGVFRLASGGNLLFDNGATGAAQSTKMTLDASGNLGLGVTPSAWDATNSIRVFQLNAGNLWNYSTTNLILGQNSYSNTSGQRTYTNNGYASEYEQGSGQHIWKTAASGTAGNAISFTQAMTLDASGRLGIGTTSPTQKLDVNGTIQGNNGFNGLSGATHNLLIDWSAESQVTTLTATNLFFGTNAERRMTITSGGNVGIGTTSPSEKLQLGGTNVGISIDGSTSSRTYYNRSGNYIWSTGLRAGDTKYYIYDERAASRLVIDDNGNVGIGTTSPLQTGSNRTVTTINGTSSAILNLGVGGSLVSYYYADASGSTLETVGTNSIVASGANIINFSTNGSERMRITSGGNVLIGTTTDNTGKLQVNGEIRMYGSTLFRGMSNNTLQLCGGTSSSNVKIDGNNEIITMDANGAERLRITSGGNVGIGTTNPTEKLEVNGNIKTAAPSGGTAKPWKLGEAGVAVGGANSTAVRVEIDGTTYYLLTAYLP
jgi:hypothetical protein